MKDMSKKVGGAHREAKHRGGPEIPVIGLVLLPPQGMAGAAAANGGPQNKKDQKSDGLDDSKLNSSQAMDKMYSYFQDINDLNINWIYEIVSFNMTQTNNANTLAKTNQKELSMHFRCNTKTKNDVQLDQDRFMNNLTTVRSNSWDCYDDITRMSLELMFHQYFKSNSDQKYRYVDINPNCKVDLKEWVEVDNDDQFVRKRIKRVRINYRERPK